MSIPLDRLYHYIDKLSQDICKDYLVIYRFYPHGSKNLENLGFLKEIDQSLSWINYYTSPGLICHDQEPLNYDLYSEDIVKKHVVDKYKHLANPQYYIEIVSKMHLRAGIEFSMNCYDLVMLTHSEKNSEELKKHENHGFVGVYWWSHAVMARDWFRYAKHIRQNKKVSKTFLIYNRSWSGTREYRLKFAELLISQNLGSQCLTKLNTVDPDLNLHYDQYNFKNTNWKPTLLLDNYFEPNSTDSYASADFELDDYESSHIEVVLETLFDDSRWHLTEKTLRPIALGQPFILVATAGSLEYLRSYGFKTFDSVWSESYDQIKSPEDRLKSIIDLMKSIDQWDEKTKKQKLIQAQKIADYNKKLFFSKTWQDNIFNEYRCNLKKAWEILKKNRTGKYVLELRSHAAHDPEWAKLLNSDLPWRTKEEVKAVEEWIKKVNC